MLWLFIGFLLIGFPWEGVEGVGPRVPIPRPPACPNLKPEPPIPQEQKPFIGVCLSGQFRNFSLVATSISENLLAYLANRSIETHIYVSSFLCDSSSEVHILLKEMAILREQHPNVHLKAIHMPFQYPTGPDMIFPQNMRTGREGTASLFNLTQTCNTLIIEGEERYSVTYDTVIRTRLDGLWTSTPYNLPLIFTENSTTPHEGSPCLHHPNDYAFKGVNDRFSVGPRDVVLAGNARFENLALLSPGKVKHVLKNSEQSLRHELLARGVCHVPITCEGMCPQMCTLPFCIARSKLVTVCAEISKRDMGGPVWNPRFHVFTHEGGKCHINCGNPKACSKETKLSPSIFRALTYEPLVNCTEELEEGFLNLNTQFTSDGSFEDICEFRTHYPSSPTFQRVYQAWEPLLKNPPPKSVQTRSLGGSLWGKTFFEMTAGSQAGG